MLTGVLLWVYNHCLCFFVFFFFFQAEDGIRDAQESRGLGDVYKRQLFRYPFSFFPNLLFVYSESNCVRSISYFPVIHDRISPCLLYTSDAADDLLCVDLGGRRIIKKKKKEKKQKVEKTLSEV